MTAENPVDKFKETYRAVQIKDRKRGFKAHLIAYGCMNTLLMGINLITGPERLWFLGSVIGWGVGIIAHWATQIATAEKQLKKMEQDTESILSKS